MIIKYLAFLFLPLFACNNTPSTGMKSNIPYLINQPSQTFELPSELLEISGLTLSKDEKSLITLQDEAGILFFLNKSTGQIEKKVTFKASGGDFEGVELVGETMYVLRSKGVISAIDNYTEESSVKTTVFDKTPLSATMDTEGLGYDGKNNRLLIACKANEQDAMSRAIWTFDVATKQYGEKALLTITLPMLVDFLTAQNADKEGFKKFFDPKGEIPFGPSAIAVHPKSGDFYLLSSVGKVLIVIDATGKIKAIEKLDKKVHFQPEGIAFEKDGTMYLSNEGKKEESAKIYVFKQK